MIETKSDVCFSRQAVETLNNLEKLGFKDYQSFPNLSHVNGYKILIGQVKVHWL